MSYNQDVANQRDTNVAIDADNGIRAYGAAVCCSSNLYFGDVPNYRRPPIILLLKYEIGHQNVWQIPEVISSSMKESEGVVQILPVLIVHDVWQAENTRHNGDGKMLNGAEPPYLGLPHQWCS